MQSNHTTVAWNHRVWQKLRFVYQTLYRDKGFYKHVEAIFHRKAEQCNQYANDDGITWQVLKWLYEYQNGFCFWNARRGYTFPLMLSFEVDHYFPLKLGGANTIDNLVLCTQSMNRRKGDKHPLDFLIELKDTNKALSRTRELAITQSDLLLTVARTERQITLDQLHDMQV